MRFRYVLIVALLPGLSLAQEAPPDLGIDYPGIFVVDEPASIAGRDSAGINDGWGDRLTMITTGLPGDLVLAEPILACEPLTNPSEIAGRIAFISRGECQFGLKALHAEQAGAIGFVVYQPDPTNLPAGVFHLINMTGGDFGHLVTIPGLFISYYRAQQVLGELVFGNVHVTLGEKGPPPGSSTEPEAELIGSHRLSTAYPNPFNTQSRFTLSVARTQHVTITLHDLLGRTVETIHQGHLAAGGPHEFTIDGSRLPSGTYLYRVVGETFSQTRRVTLLR
jgi:hypothetical protein